MTIKQEAAASAATASSPLPEHPQGVGEQTVPEPPVSVKNLVGPGGFRTDDHRYYFNGRGPVPGVTSILDVLMKWDLVKWREKSAAMAALRMTAADKAYQSEDDLVKLALRTADEIRDRQAKIGSGVHLLADLEQREQAGIALTAAETASKPSLVPDEWIPYLTAYRDFSGRYNASENIVSSEKMVWSENGYGGTFDFILKWHCKQHPDGCLWLVDVKTSKGYYPEYGLQLAAYRWSDGIILPDDPRLYPMPEIQHTALLHLRPDKYPDTGWRLIEYPTTYMDDYLAFLGALEAYKWNSKKRFRRSMLEEVSISSEGH